MNSHAFPKFDHIRQLLIDGEYLKAVLAFERLNTQAMDSKAMLALEPLLQQLEGFAVAAAGESQQEHKETGVKDAPNPDAVYEINMALGRFYLHKDPNIQKLDNQARKYFYRAAEICLTNPVAAKNLDLFLTAVHYCVTLAKKGDCPLHRYRQIPARLPIALAELEDFPPGDRLWLLLHAAAQDHSAEADLVVSALQKNTALLQIALSPGTQHKQTLFLILQNLYGMGVNQDVNHAIALLQSNTCHPGWRSNYLIPAYVLQVKKEGNASTKAKLFDELLRVCTKEFLEDLANFKLHMQQFHCNQIYGVIHQAQDPRHKLALTKILLSSLQIYLGKFNAKVDLDYQRQMFSKIIHQSIQVPEQWQAVIDTLSKSLETARPPEVTQFLIEQLQLLAQVGQYHPALCFAANNCLGNYFYAAYKQTQRVDSKLRDQALRAYQLAAPHITAENHAMLGNLIDLLVEDETQFAAVIRYSEQALQLALFQWNSQVGEKIILSLGRLINTPNVDASLKKAAQRLLETYQQFREVSQQVAPELTHKSLQALMGSNDLDDELIYAAYIRICKDAIKKYLLADTKFLFNFITYRPGFQRFQRALIREVNQALQPTESPLLTVLPLSADERAVLNFLHQFYRYAHLENLYNTQYQVMVQQKSDPTTMCDVPYRDPSELQVARVAVFAALHKLTMERLQEAPYKNSEAILAAITQRHGKDGQFAVELNALTEFTAKVFKSSQAYFTTPSAVKGIATVPFYIKKLLELARVPSARDAIVKIIKNKDRNNFFASYFQETYVLAFYANDLAAVYSLYEKPAPQVVLPASSSFKLFAGKPQSPRVIQGDSVPNQLLYGAIYLLLTNDTSALLEQYGKELDLQQMQRRRRVIEDTLVEYSQHREHGPLAQLCQAVCAVASKEKRSLFNAFKYFYVMVDHEVVNSTLRWRFPTVAQFARNFLEKEAAQLRHPDAQPRELMNPFQFQPADPDYWPGISSQRPAAGEAKAAATPAETGDVPAETNEYDDRLIALGVAMAKAASLSVVSASVAAQTTSSAPSILSLASSSSSSPAVASSVSGAAVAASPASAPMSQELVERPASPIRDGEVKRPLDDAGEGEEAVDEEENDEDVRLSPEGQPHDEELESGDEGEQLEGEGEQPRIAPLVVVAPLPVSAPNSVAAGALSPQDAHSASAVSALRMQRVYESDLQAVAAVAEPVGQNRNVVASLTK